MSPQFRRNALIGFAVLLTGVLVLSAMAVAQRDARNVPDNEIVQNPTYSQQEIEPLAIPAPFRQERIPLVISENQFPETGLIRQHNPLRSTSHDLHNSEILTAASVDEVPNDIASISINTTQRATRTPPSVAVTDAVWQSAADANDLRDVELDVVPVAGYGLPNPNENAQSNAGSAAIAPPVSPKGLLPPPLPAFNNTFPSLPSPTATPATLAAAPKSKPQNANVAPADAMRMPTTSELSSMPKLPTSTAPNAAVMPQFDAGGLARNADSELMRNDVAESNAPSGLPALPALAMPSAQPLSMPMTSLPMTSAQSPSLPTSASPMPSVSIPLPSADTIQPSFAPANNYAPPSAVGKTLVANLTSVRPGERSLDGTQVPSLQIQKLAPQEIQVGHPATFTILVKNVGTIAATSVTVQDALPDGTRLVATNPKADLLPDNRLVWSIGDLAAGGQQTLTVELVPEIEGEIGSVATVHFAAQASVRTMSTQPKLMVHQTADPSVLIGEKTKLRLTVSNDGTGVAYDVSLEEDIPNGFRHPHGEHLGLQLNDIAPGESRTVDLELEATEAGVKQNVLRLLASNAEPIVSSIDIEIVAPKLALNVEGPRLRYLERQANYRMSVTNDGTATARNVELMAYLPRGLRFNSAGNHGEYIAAQHAVVWSLEELAARGTATTDLVLLPVEEGEFVIRLQGRAERSGAEPFEKQVRIEGQSELAFSVEDDNDPIEVDNETTYAIRLSNVGTRGDSNIQVVAELPQGAVLRAVSAPVDYQLQGNQLVFAPIASMNSKDQQLIRFSVQLQGDGTKMLRVAVKSDLRPVAVVKEESTQVYSDY